MAAFKQVAVIDFEHQTQVGPDDDRPIPPKVLCLTAYLLDENLSLIRIVTQWFDEFGSAPPFDVGPDTVVVAYSAWAECQCFLQLGWELPENILDLHTAFLSVTNILRPAHEKKIRVKKDLIHACFAYGIEGWSEYDKTTIASDIGKGLWRKHGKENCLGYNEEDVKRTCDLLRAMLRDRLRPIEPVRVIAWSEYSAKCAALVQSRGMPIGSELWLMVQEHKARVLENLLREFDPTWGGELYEDDPALRLYDSGAHLSMKRVEGWLGRVGLLNVWPRTPGTGMLATKSATFKLMASATADRPALSRALENIGALRDTVNFISHASLPIGPDWRNRPSLFPFGTSTSRNAHARSPFNAHAAVRSFMLFPDGSTGFYLDWRSQEVAVAAGLFGDETLREDYLKGDFYYAMAELLGLTDGLDAATWKRERDTVRDQMKILCLAMLYGMGPRSIGLAIGRHPLVGAAIRDRFAWRYAKFWEGRDAVVDRLRHLGVIYAADGWPLRISYAPNEKSILNFPCQSGGAVMLRKAVVDLCRADIVPIMTVHDGLLFEEKDPAKIIEAQAIMNAAGREVCDGIDVGVSVDWSTLKGGQRFHDKRRKAKELWGVMMETLVEVGAMPADKLRETVG